MPDPARGGVDRDRDAHREREAVRGHEREHRVRIDPAQLLDALVPRRACRPRRRRAATVRLLVVARANLLHVGVEELRLARGVAIRPDEDALGTYVDVEAGEVEAEQPLERLRRQQLLRTRQLLDRLAGVAHAVGLQVAGVHLRDSLHEHLRRALHPAAGGVREQQRDLRVVAGVLRLLRVAERGCHVDAWVALLVVRGERPADRPAARVHGRELRRDEPVEDLLDLGRQRGGHGRRLPRAQRSERSGKREPPLPAFSSRAPSV